MYAMRPATTHDAEPIAALVRSRALWLRDRGDADWREFHDHAGVYAAQAADPDVPVWALIGDNGVLGVTSCTPNAHRSFSPETNAPSRRSSSPPP